MTIDTNKLIQLFFGAMITILLSVGLYIIKDMKDDIREIRTQNQAILENFGDDINDANLDRAKIRIEIEKLKAKGQ